MSSRRRGVQFQHRNGQNGRPSASEGDAPSEPGSPVKSAMNGKLDSSKEQV